MPRDTPSHIQVTLYDLNMLVIKPATAQMRVSYVELVAEAGTCEIVQCPKGHLRMNKVGARNVTEACDGCNAKDLKEHFQCVRCEYKYCSGCAEKAKKTIARAELQAPEFFVSHWCAQPS